MKKLVFLLFIIMLLAPYAEAQKVLRKFVAVVETQIDKRSGAGGDINTAEVSELTNEIRREAVNNLPRDRFSVMTTETVLAMGDAVLEECAEENCVISLGTKIGADYIVRGVISKFGDNLTMTVEMFETEYGMLVATAAPVRSRNLAEFLEKTQIACSAMFKKFVEESAQAAPPAAKTKPERQEKPQKSSALKLTLRLSTAALAAGGIAGGVYYNGKAKDAYDKFYDAEKGSQAEASAKKKTEDHTSTRNLLYIVGGIGLAGLTLTFVF